MNNKSFCKSDQKQMRRAIELAKKGRFTTNPNPNVGCVIVLNDKIIGEGYHAKAGLAHAEINALDMAKYNVKDATCFVTLEPCSHFGRTPPCALALVKAGISRVVIAMTDPNPKVSGKGIAILEEAGIKVEVGLLEKEAIELNLGFIKRMQTSLPRVTVKLAASLDGKTALSNGKSKWITGTDARIDVQYYRSKQCAILTGIGTILADDPSLNVRYSELCQSEEFLNVIDEEKLRQPIRIILDPNNKLTLDENIFKIPGKIIIATLKARDDLSNLINVEQLIVADDKEGRICLSTLLKHLNKIEINDLWIESGATLAGEFFKQKLVDEFILYQAPILMGNYARNLVNLPQFNEMPDVISFEFKSIKLIGKDLRMICSKRADNY